MNAAILLKHYDRISEAPDAIPRLRRFILDLAVRGKLVEQDPRDEPASELLKRIRAEKARLVKDESIRKQLVLEAVSADEQPFEICKTWHWVRFGAIADFSAGRTPSRHDTTFWNTGDYPWVSIADMTTGETIFATKETVSEKAKTKVFGSEPSPVGTMIMSFKLSIGKIARLGVPAFHNEAIISIRPHLAQLENYLFMLLPQFSRMGDTKDAIKGATLNRDSLTNILLPLPPLAEQQRIVAKVDELMALCDQLEAARNEREAQRQRLTAASLQRLNQPADAAALRADARFYLDNLTRLTTRPEQIKQLRQTILNLAVRGCLVPQDPKDEPASELLKRIQAEKARLVKAGEVKKSKDVDPIDQALLNTKLPSRWVWAQIDNISAKVTDGEHLTPKRETSGYYLLSARNVTERGIDLRDVDFVGEEEFRRIRRRCDPNKGDILISCSGSVGRIAIADKDDTYVMVRSCAMIRLTGVPLLQTYISMTLQSPLLQEQMVKRSKATAQANLFIGAIKQLVIPLPPLTEQHRIVARVDELMALCDQLEAQLTTTAGDSRRLLEAVLRDALHPATLST